jgi:hypothetical protein
MVGFVGTAEAPGPVREQAVRSYVRSGIKGCAPASQWPMNAA